MTDFKLYEYGDGGELNLSGGDIEPEKGLSNAIYLSLFTGDNWYNVFEERKTTDSFETSLFSLLTTSNNLKKIETIANESLNWLIEDGIVESIETRATANTNGHINLSIIITEPNNTTRKYSIIWEQQNFLFKNNI
jgi:phage gp46-like protein